MNWNGQGHGGEDGDQAVDPGKGIGIARILSFASCVLRQFFIRKCRRKQGHPRGNHDNHSS